MHWAMVFALTSAEPEPSIRDLGWMIGDWAFHDSATDAAGFNYEEKGQRSCRWALQDRYIRCESAGGTATKQRSYVTYLNYNAFEQRFEMMSMWSNHPPKLLQVGQMARDGLELRLRSVQPTRGDDGVVKNHWAVLRFDGKSRWTWESGSRPEGAVNDGPVRFRDVALRQAAQ